MFDLQLYQRKETTGRTYILQLVIYIYMYIFIDLSTTCLTDTEVRVLSTGLKFTPTPRRSTIEIKKIFITID